MDAIIVIKVMAAWVLCGYLPFIGLTLYLDYISDKNKKIRFSHMLASNLDEENSHGTLKLVNAALGPFVGVYYLKIWWRMYSYFALVKKQNKILRSLYIQSEFDSSLSQEDRNKINNKIYEIEKIIDDARKQIFYENEQ